MQRVIVIQSINKLSFFSPMQIHQQRGSSENILEKKALEMLKFIK